jgi:hypothetical protein
MKKRLYSFFKRLHLHKFSPYFRYYSNLHLLESKLLTYNFSESFLGNEELISVVFLKNEPFLKAAQENLLSSEGLRLICVQRFVLTTSESLTIISAWS